MRVANRLPAAIMCAYRYSCTEALKQACKDRLGNRSARPRGSHQCLRAACRSACAVAVCNAMLNSAGVKLGNVLATAAIIAGAGVPTAIRRVMHEAMLEVSAMVTLPGA